VQQVTSSIVYSSGSNIFGNSLANTQQFTGSVGVTGSLAVAGALSGTSGTLTGALSGTSATFSDRLNVTKADATSVIVANYDINNRMEMSANGFNLVGGNPFYIKQAGGSNQFTVTTTGNIGIGTTSPASQATGATTGILDVSAATGGNLVLHRTGSGDTALFSILKSTNGTYIDSTGAATAANNAIYFRTNNINADQTSVTTALTISSTGAATFASSVAINGSTSVDVLTISRNVADNAGGITLYNAETSGYGSALTFRVNYAGVYNVSRIHGDWGTGNSGLLHFFTANTSQTLVERMLINGSGNVIIGNTTAYGGLTVSDFTTNDGNDSLAFFYRGTSGGHESLIKFYDFRGQVNASMGNNLEDDGSGTQKARLVFKTSNSGAPIERMRITSGGKIEMGSTSVSGEIAKITGTTGADNYLSVYSGTIHMFLDADATNSSGIVGTQSNHNLILRTNGTNKVWVTPAGNVGFGRDRPATNLDVVKNSSNPIRMERTGDSGGFVDLQLFGAGGSNYFALGGDRIHSNQINNLTTASAANVFIGADSNGITNVLHRSTSSLKYKIDIRDYDKGLDFIKTLRPVYYKGKTDGDKQFAGLIAEEVHASGLEEFVQYAQDGSPDSLAYTHITALLINGIKELKAKIESLEAENDNLKSRLEVLEQS
jgi:hypothetical protein